jgi:hypothetical protein
VPAGLFDEAQEAFFEDGLETQLAADRRPVL